MQFSALAVLLAIGSAVAAPTTAAKRSSALQVTDFWINASRASGVTNAHLILTDPNYPDDTPVECNVKWSVALLGRYLLILMHGTDERMVISRAFNGNPVENPRCLGGQYYIRFPNGGKDVSQITLELERVEGPIPEKARVTLNDETEGSKWKCGPTDNPGVTERCNYDGVLEIPV
ncbi:uncharacterized protein KD926_009276 [Aspergillus affinis]|uniref:uncharacterized protein n=1 Tax=Aspergillus affinis TaxID=1070780 RepID=UPI0022FF007B|nr:uncharacterized protein KD926_009276 [Aspergillus affinis]KAI9039551.1 hypothetical protein KD926_009276 [Aspergillus affinis]